MEHISGHLKSYSHWFLDRPTDLVGPLYAIAIDNPDPDCDFSVATKLADYLNEFSDLHSSLQWHAFDVATLQSLSTNPVILRYLDDPGNPVRSIAKLGGCIVEGNGINLLTANLPHIFQVCLSCQNPSGNFHLHLKKERFKASKVVPVIADSFLEWVDGGGDPATNAEPPATDARQTPEN